MSNPGEYIIVFVTTGSKEEAQKFAHTLVGEQLAACCTIIDSVQSIYSWENKTCVDTECLMIIKSRQQIFPHLEKRIKELHSYKVPEIIAVPLTEGSQSYLDWLDLNVKRS
jgi:periplasmic divalent cation tolerance protein